MKYERLTKLNQEPKTIFCFSGSMQDFKIYKRLQELEDKIEQETIKEQKTCKNVSEMHPVDGFTCSECGISIEDYSEKEVDEENDDITYREYMFRYCPNCGQRWWKNENNR